MRVLLPPMVLVVALVAAPSSESDRTAGTRPNVCATNASIGHAVIAAINLSWPGLEAVASAATAGDLGTACEALATYYTNANTAAWLRLPAAPRQSARKVGGEADAAVDHDIWNLCTYRRPAPARTDPDSSAVPFLLRACLFLAFPHPTSHILMSDLCAICALSCGATAR